MAGPGTLSAKENLWRAITHNHPDYVPVRRMDGSVAGMARLIYKDSRALLQGVDRWGVVWAGGVAATSERETEIQGYPVKHPLENLSQLDNFPFPDPAEAGIMDGLLEGWDAGAALMVGEICFPVQDRAHLLMGLDQFCVALLEQPEAVHRLLHRIADYEIGIVERYLGLGANRDRGRRR